MEIYYLPDGRPSGWPVSREVAKQKKRLKYNAGARCGLCNLSSLRFTSNDRCLGCARKQALHLFNIATGAAYVPDDYGPLRVCSVEGGYESGLSEEQFFELRDALHSLGLSGDFSQPVPAAKRIPTSATGCTTFVRFEPCRRHGHLGIRTPEGDCAECAKPRVSPRQAAIAAGETWYAPATPCKRCGTLAPRSVARGECRGCMKNRPPSARQAAIAAGETWYGPDTDCRHCGVRAPRRVDNGQCWCRYPTGRRSAQEAVQLMKDLPEMEIGRDAARSLGFSVYQEEGRWRYTLSGHEVD